MNQVIDRIDENAFPLGQALGGKTAPSAAKTGMRKALGNLTNAKQQPGASTAGKQRRAFGELWSIANNDYKPPSTSQAPSVAAVAADRSQQIAEQYAAGGVERLAGKGWNQLESERTQREEAEIEASVQRMTAGLSSWGVMQVGGRSLAICRVCKRGAVPFAWRLMLPVVWHRQHTRR